MTANQAALCELLATPSSRRLRSSWPLVPSLIPHHLSFSLCDAEHPSSPEFDFSKLQWRSPGRRHFKEPELLVWGGTLY